MTEQGIVTQVKKGKAKVKVNKKDECSKCGLCLFPKGAESIEFTADNSLNAKEGDEVIISREKDGKFLAIVLVFLVPLLLVGVAVALGIAVIGNEILIPVIAVGLIVIWYTALSLLDKKIKTLNSFIFKIIKIIDAEERGE